MSREGFWRHRSLRVPDDKRTKVTELSFRQSLAPLSLVTLLFFLWGFSHGLLDTLNKHFQDTLGISRTRSTGLQVAYFGAFPFASLGHATWILRRFGYRAAFIWGLALFGLGALLTMPSVVHRSFVGFCISTFIIVCGPPKYAELRLNIAQAFSGVGTVAAPALGSYVFFAVDDKAALKNVQWVYLGIACVVFGLGAVFYLSAIPEISDANLQFQATETQVGEEIPFRKQYRLFHASFAQFCYVGAHVAVTSFFINYVTETRPNTDSALASKFLSGAQTALTIGRFVGAGMMRFIRPRKVFGAFVTMCIVFMAPSITERWNIGMGMLCVTLFFDSVCFPTIMALGIRGLGRHTKRGSGYIIAGVFGGACVPPLTGVVADRHGSALSMVVPLSFYVGTWTYALAVNFWPWYRDTVDAFTLAEFGLNRSHDRAAETEADSAAGVDAVDEKAVDVGAEKARKTA
ncbi:major facilitator superfamily domain-containing protein [Podospora aff. communis PSN243]|uniref:Major facilitator superfamily domain-containing protein n=1 Tax=Podospora aff. communis PSN243 TaxID=3040156 RepID=A0AAV9GF82_9PEZI|nr:major facilitator superfamily domain-containing protein [Podospora aff. communis PSN243]